MLCPHIGEPVSVYGTSRERGLANETILSVRAPLEGGDLPTGEMVENMRTRVIGSVDSASSYRAIPVIKHYIFRTVAILFGFSEMQTNSVSAIDMEDDKARDSKLMGMQRCTHRFARREPSRRLPSIFSTCVANTVCFTSRENGSSGKALSPVNRSEMIAIIFDLVMLAIKRRFGALALEHRSSQALARAFDLTISTAVRRLFRTPSDDFFRISRWAYALDAARTNCVCVDLVHFLKAVSENVSLRSQVKAVAEICECLDGGTNPHVLGYTEASCVDWNNPMDVLRKIEPSAMIHALRPPPSISADNRIAWWLDKLVCTSADCADLRLRSLLASQMTRNPERFVEKLVRIASTESFREILNDRDGGCQIPAWFIPSRAEPSEPITKEPPKEKWHRSGDDDKVSRVADSKANSVPPKDLLGQFVEALDERRAEVLLRDPCNKAVESVAALLKESRENLGDEVFFGTLQDAVVDCKKNCRAVENFLSKVIPDWRNCPRRVVGSRTLDITKGFGRDVTSVVQLNHLDAGTHLLRKHLGGPLFG